MSIQNENCLIKKEPVESTTECRSLTRFIAAHEQDYEGVPVLNEITLPVNVPNRCFRILAFPGESPPSSKYEVEGRKIGVLTPLF